MSFEAAQRLRAPMATPSSTHRGLVQRRCACGGKATSLGECDECRKKRGILYHSSLSGDLDGGEALAPPIVHGALSAPGRPVASDARSDAERRPGHDFSTVRTHAGAQRSRSASRALRRAPQDDSIHQPLIDDFRRQQGLPPGGVDESGQRVGPSDAQIKYGGLLMPFCPPIQANERRQNLLEGMCLTSSSQAASPRCRFSGEQRRHLAAGVREAQQRVDRALRYVRSGRQGRRLARDMARDLFSSNPPPVGRVVRVLRGMQTYLQGGGPPFVGRSCGDRDCHTAVAYVHGAGQLPIHICPRAFLKPGEIFRTVIHEVVHLAGIDADPATPEGYCSTFDCRTPCLSGNDADAWSHYIECLGRGIEPRQDFIPELDRSLEDLP